MRISDLSIERAYNYLIILENSNEGIQTYYEQAKQLTQKDKISADFFREFHETLKKKAQNNENIIEKIEAHIFDKMKKDLGVTVTLPTDLIRLEEKLKQEFLRKEKEDKKKRPNLQKVKDDKTEQKTDKETNRADESK